MSTVIKLDERSLLSRFLPLENRRPGASKWPVSGKAAVQPGRMAAFYPNRGRIKRTEDWLVMHGLAD